MEEKKQVTIFGDEDSGKLNKEQEKEKKKIEKKLKKLSLKSPVLFFKDPLKFAESIKEILLEGEEKGIYPKGYAEEEKQRFMMTTSMPVEEMKSWLKTKLKK